MAHGPTVLRLFSGHGESPLWLDGYGNVDPQSIKLEADLGRRLREWADYFSENFVSAGRNDLDWRKGSDAGAYEADGMHMAEELFATWMLTSRSGPSRSS